MFLYYTLHIRIQSFSFVSWSLLSKLNFLNLLTFRFHSKIFIKLEIRVSQNLSRKSGGRPVKCQGWEGRPFPSSPGPLFQNEVKYSAFGIPLWLLFDMEMIFHSHANKTHFLKRGCALSLNLKVRAFETRKWPIGSWDVLRVRQPRSSVLSPVR